MLVSQLHDIEKKIFAQSLIKRGRNVIHGFLALFIGIILFPGLQSCNSKTRQTETASKYFTINGKELERDVIGIPDSIDSDVYQATVNEPVIFLGEQAISPNENHWYIDGTLAEKGNNQFEHRFQFPGLYQVKHCHGMEDCVIRYLYVREPLATIEETPEITEMVIQEPISSARARSETRKIEAPQKVETEHFKTETPFESNKPIEIPKPVETPTPVEKPVAMPPEKFTNSGTTGLSVNSFNADCVKWVEFASIRLKPKEFCLLNTAIIYGSGKGKVRINLSDGSGYNESMSITLTDGRTQFAFSDLIPVLHPDDVYTLTMSTIAGTDGVKPTIGNISSCKTSPKKNSALEIDYGSNDVLFDINYKVK